MKTLIAILLTISFSYAYAQRGMYQTPDTIQRESEKFVLPIDASGKICFSKIGETPGITKSELYSNARFWFVDTYKSAESVVQLEDKDAGVIVGKALEYIYIETAFGAGKQKMFYTIKVYVKDNKWKAEITDIYYQDAAGGYPTYAEQFITDSYLYKKNGELKKLNQQYKDETVDNSFAILSSLGFSIQKKITIDKSDW